MENQLVLPYAETGRSGSPQTVAPTPQAEGALERGPERLPNRDMPLQRKNSSLLNAMAAAPPRKLHHQPSKLDLIDDTTLTSLPFPPPPAKSRLRRGNLLSSRLSKSSGSVGGDAHLGASCLSLNISISAQPEDVATIVEMSEDNYDTTMGADETFEELQDPIVLVEDYVRDVSLESENNHMLARKASLATFKRRYMSGRGRSTTLPLFETSSRAETDSFVSDDGPVFTESEDLEAIFGKIPGSDKLKHCDLCDKPLYEISSIITSTGDDHGASPRSEEFPQLYNEFVCWECINVYEHFLGELYETEAAEARKLHSEEERSRLIAGKLRDMLGTIDKPVHDDDLEFQPPRKQIRPCFSTDLINRLHYLSTMAEPKPPASEWLNNLRLAVRWRWRLQNLLPDQFTFDKQRNQ